jgi:hypothetical protein
MKSMTGEILDERQARELRKMRRQPFLKIGLKFLRRRTDAKMDSDGHCTVCGCEVREWEGGTDKEAMRRHVCPAGFRTIKIT